MILPVLINIHSCLSGFQDLHSLLTVGFLEKNYLCFNPSDGIFSQFSWSPTHWTCSSLFPCAPSNWTVFSFYLLQLLRSIPHSCFSARQDNGPLKMATSYSLEHLDVLCYVASGIKVIDVNKAKSLEGLSWILGGPNLTTQVLKNRKPFPVVVRERERQCCWLGRCWFHPRFSGHSPFPSPPPVTGPRARVALSLVLSLLSLLMISLSLCRQIHFHSFSSLSP